ncbi:DUF421 domain-containing protein [Sporolactobacillus sp. CPB3-1]|uniref:DUF421 domain-containing protein n=1 Tax=Sporolactobacillus mangiferae TaxID=2940498 RepID=A0ABT0M6M7_9BACL|nr:DUF421 domain-containing protein [Sporolactobacillus mangiferae]MCL1630524.1 DUF421 domain-containing protein [Sporolactobacillus mangiferae]
MHFVRISIELILGFAALFLMTKILGKATLAQVTPFDFISAIVLGEFVGNALYDPNIGIGSIFFAIALWGALIYIVEWCTQKFRKTRGFLEGSPTIVIRHGHMDKLAMKKEKLDIDMLQNLLRQKDVFSVREVEHAILETDGSVSVLRKSQYDTPTQKDLQQPKKAVYLPYTLIDDGEVDWDNLKEAGLNEEWLLKSLRQHHIKSYKDVFYCDWKKDEGVFIEKY